MRKLIRATLTFAVLTTLPLTASASCLTDVSAFTNAVCGEIIRDGNSTTVSGGVAAGAESDSIIKRVLGKMNISIDVDVVRKAYHGPVQEQLVEANRDIILCKRDLAKIGIDAICRLPRGAQNIDIIDAWYGVGGKECHAIKARFYRACQGKASCPIECDNSSDCRDPAKNRSDKICVITYQCAGGHNQSAVYQEHKAIDQQLSCPQDE